VVVDRIRYSVDNGAKWRALPADFPRGRLTLHIVSRPKGTKGFVVLPRRWKVERTIGWCMNARRNARDYERLPQHSEAHLNWALINVMTRRITRKQPRPRWTKRPPQTTGWQTEKAVSF
jgi:transposase